MAQNSRNTVETLMRFKIKGHCASCGSSTRSSKFGRRRQGRSIPEDYMLELPHANVVNIRICTACYSKNKNLLTTVRVSVDSDFEEHSEEEIDAHTKQWDLDEYTKKYTPRFSKKRIATYYQCTTRSQQEQTVEPSPRSLFTALETHLEAIRTTDEQYVSIKLPLLYSLLISIPCR